jgi:hypothetical protein
MALMALPFFLCCLGSWVSREARYTSGSSGGAIRFERYGCVGGHVQFPHATVLVEEFLCDICTIYTNRDDELAQKNTKGGWGGLL